MCVEAAVCYALGLPHGDEPTCVDEVIRRYKITLNDNKWSSNAARVASYGKDDVLLLASTKIAEDVLIDMDVPGVEFLELINLKGI